MRSKPNKMIEYVRFIVHGRHHKSDIAKARTSGRRFIRRGNIDA